MKKTSVVLSNGTSLAYLARPEKGDGDAVVLLHGITDNALTYEGLLDQVEAKGPVYALDLRGHGESTRREERYTTEAYADDVRCFIREVAGAPVSLAGHSLGGLIATQVAATAPELVSRVLLEDPPPLFCRQARSGLPGRF